jgi:hypothetical protein
VADVTLILRKVSQNESRSQMTATLETPAANLSSAQATDLSVLVDLEARWENLRIYQPTTSGMPTTLKELHQKQKAYEAFFAKLVAYNKEYRPAHVPELLLNNASRLGGWCWKMRDLQLQVQHDSPAHFPVHLLEKAYRWADRLADRMKTDRLPRSPLAGNIPSAIRALEELAWWCDNLTRVTPTR